MECGHPSTLLSEQPDFSEGLDTHLFGESLLAPPRREMGCVGKDRLVPRVPEPKKTEL